MTAFFAVVLVVLAVGGGIVAARSHAERRRRWQKAAPFVGEWRAAPELAITPNVIVYTEYLGVFISVAALIALALVLF